MAYALITGASAGIGAAVAHKLASEQKDIIITARRTSRLQSLKNELEKEYSIKVETIQTDLSDSIQVQKLWEKSSRLGVDLLINNAGLGSMQALPQQFLGSLDETILDVNIKALTHLSLQFIAEKDEKAERGTIINLSSVVGYSVASNSTVYSASKFYVSAFTESLHKRLKESNSKVHVKILAPALTETEFFSVANNTPDASVKNSGNKYHTAAEMADFLWQLANSDNPIGIVNPKDYSFQLRGCMFPSF